MERKIIIDLCAGSGAWSRPYQEARDSYGNALYDVRLITLPEYDVRTYVPPDNVYGILAAPPCTHLSSSGARWFKGKGNEALLEALSIVDACLRIIWRCYPVFWSLENPVGRLSKYLGKPVLYFNPCDYGDPWTKKTCLWGSFYFPVKNPVKPIDKSPIWYMAPSWKRSELRSITPAGFARAFFESNK